MCFRARGKENFFHCDKCGFCLALGKRENHTCRQNISRNNCPICLEVCVVMLKMCVVRFLCCRTSIHQEILLMYLAVDMCCTRELIAGAVWFSCYALWCCGQVLFQRADAERVCFCCFYYNVVSAVPRLYQCPQCQISLVDMRQTWERMDTERDSWVMPQQLRQFKVKVCTGHCTSTSCCIVLMPQAFYSCCCL